MALVTASASWTDGERFLCGASTGDHPEKTVIVDADRARNSAPGPMELVLIGLCTCTATDVLSILNKKREKFSVLKVRAEGRRAEKPPTVYETIKLVYSVSSSVTPKAMEDAARLSEEKYCSVAAMLSKTAKIDYEIEYV